MKGIHKTAIISESAIIGENCTIGPYCIVGDHVKIGNNTELKSHVIIEGHTTIGENNKFYPFACIGMIPQDLKYSGESSEVIIGDNNVIREHVTIHPGTLGGGMKTRIGSFNLLMVGVHIAHDCIIGNYVIMANNATVAGHVEIDDYVVMGGMSAVAQFMKIGSFAMIGGLTGIEKNVSPYSMVMGERGKLSGINHVGLARRSFDKEDIKLIQRTYNSLFFDDNSLALTEKINNLSNEAKQNEHIQYLLTFIAESKRGICEPRRKRKAA